MGHTWTASRQIRRLVLDFARRHRRVTARQVGQHLARLGYSSASARWHLNRLAREGELCKVGGPTYYEVNDVAPPR